MSGWTKRQAFDREEEVANEGCPVARMRGVWRKWRGRYETDESGGRMPKCAGASKSPVKFEHVFEPVCISFERTGKVRAVKNGGIWWVCNRIKCHGIDKMFDQDDSKVRKAEAKEESYWRVGGWDGWSSEKLKTRRFIRTESGREEKRGRWSGSLGGRWGGVWMVILWSAV